eukprot:1991265-Prymnesium_polylepis.1
MSRRVACRDLGFAPSGPKNRIMPQNAASPVRAAGTAEDRTTRSHLSGGWPARGCPPDAEFVGPGHADRPGGQLASPPL